MPAKLIYLVLETLEKPWNWNRLSANPNIDQEDVLEHPDLPWNWRMFSMNPGLRFEFVLAHLDWDWCWTALTENPAINWNHVSEHRDLPWNWSVVAYNRNIRVETLLNEGLPNVSKSVNLRFHHVLANPAYPWNWYDLTTNRCVWTAADLTLHPELSWHWPYVSSSCEITRDLFAMSGLPWDYSSLSFNPSVTLELIDAFPLIPWDWTRVSQNPNLTLDYVLTHPERPWDWDLIHYFMPLSKGVTDFRRRVGAHFNEGKLSFNPSLQVQDVLENPDIKWSSSGLSRNLVVTASDLQQMHAVLDWTLLSMNPSLRLETIMELRHAPWDWTELSSHRFGV